MWPKSKAEKAAAPDEYTGPRNAKEGFYEVLIEKFHLDKRKMDLVLIILAALFVLLLVIGALKGNNII